MNKNFHWYAVKTILADPDLFGTEQNQDRDSDEAYKIAYFSQFVDDYNLYVPFIIDDSDVPPEGIYLKTKEGYINPVTTGFNLYPPDDMLNFFNIRDYYKKVVIPFHFIPKYNFNELQNCPDEIKDFDITTYTVKRLELTAENAERTVLGGLMKDAKTAYIGSAAGTPKRDKAVVLIGILLHIFADTYAHEHFNGFRSDYNYVDVKEIKHYLGDLSQTDNVTRTARIISSVKTTITETAAPKIGHGMAGSEPDYNNATMYYNFTRRGTLTPVTLPHDGYNLALDCAFEIYNYLRRCKGLPSVIADSPQWRRLSSELSFGFLMDSQIGDSETGQKNRWHQIPRLRNLNYDYDMGFLFSKMTDQSGNENPSLSWRQFFTATLARFTDAAKLPVKMNNSDFWYYNYFARLIRNAVNGTNFIGPDLSTYLSA
jgi:hypothetical protein